MATQTTGGFLYIPPEILQFEDLQGQGLVETQIYSIHS